MLTTLFLPLLTALAPAAGQYDLASITNGQSTCTIGAGASSLNNGTGDCPDVEAEEFTVDDLDAIDIDSDYFWDRFYTTYRMPDECREVDDGYVERGDVVSDDSLSCVGDDTGSGSNQSGLAGVNQPGGTFFAGGGGFGPAAAGGDLYQGARVVEDAGGICWLEMTTNRLEGTSGRFARQYYRLGTRAEVFNAAGRIRSTVARQIIRVLESPRNYRFLGRIILRGIGTGGVLLLFEGAAVAGELLPRLVLPNVVRALENSTDLGVEIAQAVSGGAIPARLTEANRTCRGTLDAVLAVVGEQGSLRRQRVDQECIGTLDVVSPGMCRTLWNIANEGVWSAAARQGGALSRGNRNPAWTTYYRDIHPLNRRMDGDANKICPF